MNPDEKPLVTLVIPAYNEEAILTEHLKIITEYMATLEDRYSWEIVLVNDGSKDNTGPLADAFASSEPRVRVVHHPVNLNLGNALKTGFRHARGKYIVTLDLDLSYSPDHIERMLDTLVQTRADMVIASPYMKGGKVSNVPWMRKVLSRMVNRLMYIAAQEKFHTFTGMVRAYDARFVRSLNLKTKDYEINPEIMYKAFILRARIIEIPAHLNWSLQKKAGKKRTSGMRVLRGIFSGFMASFIFRPYIFFFSVGTFFFLISLYIIIWLFINGYRIYPLVQVDSAYFDDRLSATIAMLFQTRPHAFLIGGFVLLVSLLFLGIGFLSLQNKRYFEEQFHIATTLLKHHRGLEENGG